VSLRSPTVILEAGRRAGGRRRPCGEDDEAAATQDVRRFGRRGPDLSPTRPDLGPLDGCCPLSMLLGALPWHGWRPRRGVLRAAARRCGSSGALARLGPVWAPLAAVVAHLLCGRGALLLARSWVTARLRLALSRRPPSAVEAPPGASRRSGRGLTSLVFPRVGGSRRSCSGATVYLPCFGRTISVLLVVQWYSSSGG
jgi:hypothetical protein